MLKSFWWGEQGNMAVIKDIGGDDLGPTHDEEGMGMSYIDGADCEDSYWTPS
ncbi:hypothetical protein L195_g044470 [Trifolium pratense]|uniref:Uncharacterized protein n=1 Tax=Trifolium pratense TaxID=57577 RepID=A0A2K3MC50_TRIPR|nr:hypothetical protein L195_g044470 [Trifolium pratense]